MNNTTMARTWPDGDTGTISRMRGRPGAYCSMVKPLYAGDQNFRIALAKTVLNV